jgi:hypothetical protein
VVGLCNDMRRVAEELVLVELQSPSLVLSVRTKNGFLDATMAYKVIQN